MKKYLTIVIVLILLAFLIYKFINTSTQYYGNNKEAIKKVVNSIEGYEDQSISVLEAKDFNDSRIAGILVNNRPGYIEFKKNKNGDYVWSHIEATNDNSLGFYLPDINEASNRKIMIVTSPNNQVAKLSVEINYKLIEQSIYPIQSSVTWIDLPQTESDEYRFDNYKYYDQEGNIIKKLMEADSRMTLTSYNIIFTQRAGWRRPLVRPGTFEEVESGGQPCEPNRSRGAPLGA